MTQTQDNYRVVSAGFDATLRAVGPDQWSAASPCEGWSARDVVAHVVDGHRSVVAMLGDATPEPLGADEDPVAAWAEVAAAIDGIAGDPDVSAREVAGPAGPMPVGDVIGSFVTMDLLVHTWDLARAVGADEGLDEASVARAYETLRPMDAVIRRPGTFGPRLDPPADADLQTEFLYFVGREA
jgi:uncharacterized protein (TIGR03086 family)